MVVSEHYMEAIAEKLKLDIDDVRTMNLYKEGASFLRRHRLCALAHHHNSQGKRRRTTSPSSTGTFVSTTTSNRITTPANSKEFLARLLKDCRAESDYDKRKVEVDRYNHEHRWRKRGIALLPTKFGVRTALIF